MIAAATAWWNTAPPAARGIAAMVISTLAFSAMHASIAALSHELHSFQIVFFRNVFGLLVFLPVVLRSGVGFLHTGRFWLHALRALLNVIAMMAFFTALSMTPIARVTALGFTAPLFMAILSVLFLGERMIWARWLALALGFVGTLIIVRPGFDGLDTGSLLVIGSAFVWAVTMIVIKLLSRTESSMTTTGYMVIWLSIYSAAPAVTVWTWPEPWVWIVLAFIGMAGTLAQLLLAEALKQGDATVVMPFDFLKLVWATLLGYLVLSQVPDPLVWIGAIVIFGAGTLVLVEESRARRRKAEAERKLSP